MKNSFSVFIVVLFCAVLCIGLGFLNRDTSDVSGWNPNELYSNPVLSGGSSAFTNATISGEDVNNVGVAVSMRGGRVTSSPFHHSSSAMYPSASSSYAPAGASYGQLSVATGSSPIAHMTSSAEYRSFGGGGNGGASMGGAMRGGYTSSSNVSIASSPISYSSSPITSRQSQTTYGTSDVTGSQSSAMDNPVVASSIYGTSSAVADYISTYGTASYDSYGSYGSNGRSNVRGKQNAGEDEPWFGSVWWNWLDFQYNTDGGGSGGWGTQGSDGRTWYFSHQDAEAAYNAWRQFMLNTGMVPNEDALPSYDDWLAWFMTTKDKPYKGGYGTYQFIPVGNVLPLLLFALLYIVVLSFKFRKTLKSSNENK